MRKILTKKDLYEDIQRLNEDVFNQETKIGTLNEENARVRIVNANLCDEIKDMYYLLKQIEKLTKNATIKTLCILKRNEIKNVSGVYVGDDE